MVGERSLKVKRRLAISLHIVTVSTFLTVAVSLSQEEGPLKGGILADEMGMGEYSIHL